MEQKYKNMSWDTHSTHFWQKDNFRITTVDVWEALPLQRNSILYVSKKKKHGTCLTWLTIVYYVFGNIKYSHSKHQTSWKIKISGPVHRFPAVKWFVSIYSYLKTKILSQKINFLGCGLLVFKCVINRVVGRHQKLVGVIRCYMMTVKYC